MGLCIQCSKRAVPGSPYCTKHRKYRKVVLQTQYQRRMLKSESHYPAEVSVALMDSRVRMIQFENKVKRATERVDQVTDRLRDLINDLQRLQSSDAPKGWFM
jgi:hypothetical protein